ncbi:F-box/LRR-repeat protein [Quillaja saponaria]|uniref:F-box/LRR-repeat protein n=1 Tax=Quillaja saponaria TaxID=32244 RepID=A0AAD7PW62_QUISA|nr:F-box/LRR-repeat protein [Quillaja saponaria]
MFGSSKEMLESSLLPDMPKSNATRIVIGRSINDFVRRVNQFMQHFQGRKIGSFRMAFNVDDSEHYVSIDRWISFAISRGVEKIDLLFPNKPYNLEKGHKLYVFPFNLFSEADALTLRHLTLKRCSIQPPADCNLAGFRNLRSLVLGSSTLRENFMTCLLSRCSLLEELSFRHCWFTTSLEIGGPSLRCLTFFACTIRAEVRIYATNLTSLHLEHFGSLSEISSIETPQLMMIYFDTYSLSEIPWALGQFANFPQLEILDMFMNVLEVEIFQRSNISFNNLKQLRLFIRPEYQTFDPFWVLDILRASPLLQKLSLMFTYPYSCASMIEKSDPGAFTHNELKVIEVGGCVGNWYEVEFVKYLVKHVKTLERLVLSPFWKPYGNSKWRDESCSSWVQSGRDMFREMLRGEFAGRTQLIL